MGKTLRFLLLITVLITSTTTYADKNKRKVSPNRQAVECRADDCEISHRRAINIAQNYVYKAFRVKGRVSEVEYKRRYIGANYYEVEIKDRKGHEYEIKINARTGKVIATKIDLD
ncbi:MAG: PepSY domain-containing protein [Neisseriaceae bacterium]|nr:PepSY domain-containing protein [Neisseriaceae bacterium]